MIFWKSGNWPSYSRECLLYWLRWHLVVETSSLNVKKPKFASRYYRLWMRRQVVTHHWSCWSTPTENGNSHASDSKIQNTLIASHFSQLKMKGPLWCTPRRFWGHFDIGPCGCRRVIQSHCITVSQCTMPCSITWTAWYELWLKRRLHGRKTCSSLWS